MRRFASGLAVVAAASTASSAIAIQRPATPQVWQVGSTEARCTITTGDRSAALLSLQEIPGDNWAELYVVGPAKLLGRDVEGNVTVAFAPGGEKIEADVQEYPGKMGGQVLKMHVPTDVADALAKGGAFQLLGLERPVAVSIRGAAKAVGWLRKCVDEKLAKWGIDAAAYHSLRVPPAMKTKDWIGPGDYPNSALSRAKEGSVVARVKVDSSGKVADCAVVVSSGWDPIDRVTCARAIEKAEFDPAIGADGQPTTAFRTVHVNFKIASF